MSEENAVNSYSEDSNDAEIAENLAAEEPATVHDPPAAEPKESSDAEPDDDLKISSNEADLDIIEEALENTNQNLDDEDEEDNADDDDEEDSDEFSEADEADTTLILEGEENPDVDADTTLTPATRKRKNAGTEEDLPVPAKKSATE